MRILIATTLVLATVLPATGQLVLGIRPREITPYEVGIVSVTDAAGKAVRVRYIGVTSSIGLTGEPRLDDPYNYLMFNQTEATTPAGFEFMINPLATIDGGGALRIGFETVGEQPPQRAFITVTYGRGSTPRPEIESVVNAFSAQPVISPGSLVTIYSSTLSRATLNGQYGVLSRYPTDLKQYAVKFNGVPAPILSISHDRIQAIVPYETASANAEVLVTAPRNATDGFAGNTSPPFLVPVQETTPAIRTIHPSGVGLVDARQIVTDEWKWSQHGLENPVPRGGAVELFVTGAGRWATPLRGDIAYGDPRPRPPTSLNAPFDFTGQPLSVTIGGVPAKVLYAGATFLRPWALLQVNVVVPDEAPSGQQPVVLKIGNNDNAAQRATLLIQ